MKALKIMFLYFGFGILLSLTGMVVTMSYLPGEVGTVFSFISLIIVPISISAHFAILAEFISMVRPFKKEKDMED